MYAIEAKRISKAYKIYSSPIHRLKELVFGKKKRYYWEFWALQDIDLRVEPRTTLGVIGDNGSGKSTLLRLLAGVSKPTKGEMAVNGRLTGLLDLGAGFHPEFTGRYNIFTSCSILGMSPKEINDRMQEIIDFAELEDFIDQPIKRYSTGMIMRLGFAVAISIDPDILIIDEILSVGDMYFQRKCLERIKSLKNKKTIILVSHDLNTVSLICDRVVWIHSGKIVAQGEPQKIVDQYIDYLREREDRGKRDALGTTDDGRRATDIFTPPQEGKPLRSTDYKHMGVEILDVKLLDKDGAERTVFTTGEELTIQVQYEAREKIEKPFLAFGITRNDDVDCYGTATTFDKICPDYIEGKGFFSVTLPKLPLLKGKYLVTAAIYDRNVIIPYDLKLKKYPFEVRNDWLDQGVCFMDHQWKFVNVQPSAISGHQDKAND